MEALILRNIDATRMLITILLQRGLINESTAEAIFERIKEMRISKAAA